MKILLSDYDGKRLDRLSEYIAEIYPDAEITAEADSLMAAKKCFSEVFDVVFASLDDRRLDGLKMRDFVRHSNPCGKFVLCGSACAFSDWGVTDKSGNIFEEGIDGAVSYPVTKEKLMLALGIPFEGHIRIAGKQLDDSLLELAVGAAKDFTADTDEKPPEPFRPAPKSGVS